MLADLGCDSVTVAATINKALALGARIRLPPKEALDTGGRLVAMSEETSLSDCRRLRSFQTCPLTRSAISKPRPRLSVLP